MIKRVALIIEMSNEYSREILKGIHDFLYDNNPDWLIYLTEHGRHEADNSFAEHWKGDGIIARIETKEIASIIRKMNVPIVDVSAAQLINNIPWVETDDKAITELAVKHLIDCGLRNIAYMGDPYYNWSRWRCDYFKAAMIKSGLNYSIFNLPLCQDNQSRWYTYRSSICDWLKSLPKPIGIFACYDMCGHQILEICRQENILVPEDVAVIGVDNDKLLCNLSNPTLSSVIPNGRQAGYQAAVLLNKLMSQVDVPIKKYSIKPLGVQMRLSTDILAVEDPLIANIVSFIKKHALENINVSDILKQAPLSRRIFEARFKKALNRTPHKEIQRVRINIARKLLSETEKTLAEIAEIMHFEHTEYFSVFFKKETGMTPRDYRGITQNYFLH